VTISSNPELFIHKCSQCEKSYSSSINLSIHIKKHHSEESEERNKEKEKKKKKKTEEREEKKIEKEKKKIADMNFELGESVYSGFKLTTDSKLLTWFRGDVKKIIDVNVKMQLNMKITKKWIVLRLLSYYYYICVLL
jgi:hypothetical protein